MPLQKGHSEKVMSANRRELWHAFESKGKIGTTKPRNKAHAQRIINAIAYSQARRS